MLLPTLGIPSTRLSIVDVDDSLCVRLCVLRRIFLRHPLAEYQPVVENMTVCGVDV